MTDDNSSCPNVKLGASLCGLSKGYFQATMSFPGQQDRPVLAKQFFHDGRQVATKEWLNELRMSRRISGACKNVLNAIFLSDDDDDTSPRIIFENAEFGDLHSCLRGIKLGDISCGDRVRIILDISQGLQYLHSSSIVHCRLTARSCFVDFLGTIKIGEFSHSFSLPESSCSSNCELAFADSWFIPWASYEMLFGSENLGCSSDIWSLATVMWEVFTHGQTPFLGESSEKVKRKIKHGETLPIPTLCPPYLHQLMQECWTSVSHARRSLHEIVSELQTISQSPYAQSTSLLLALHKMVAQEAMMVVLPLDLTELSTEAQSTENSSQGDSDTASVVGETPVASFSKRLQSGDSCLASRSNPRTSFDLFANQFRDILPDIDDDVDDVTVTLLKKKRYSQEDNLPTTPQLTATSQTPIEADGETTTPTTTNFSDCHRLAIANRVNKGTSSTMTRNATMSTTPRRYSHLRHVGGMQSDV